MRRVREILKWLFGALFALAGVNHFINTEFYVGIMPPYLPLHAALIYISGVAEIILGLTLLFRHTERFAAWGMVALIIAVTPVHVQMVIYPELYSDYSQTVLWTRLLLQPLLAGLAYWFTRPHCN